MIKTYPASNIPQISTVPLADQTSPGKLVVHVAKFGDIVRQSGARAGDPLILGLAGVEPKADIEFLNFSKKPDADWKKTPEAIRVLLSAEQTWVPLDDGRLGLIIGNEDAKKLGIDPGDVFEIRQVDAARNKGPETRVRLDQKSSASVNLSKLGHLEKIGAADVQVRDETVTIQPYPDRFAPNALTKKMVIAAAGEGKGELSGSLAIEPGATVYVRNEAKPQKVFEGKVIDNKDNPKEDRTFRVPFEAEIGHPLHVWVVDGNGVKTDLGLTSFAPEEGCVKGGPLAAHQLQQKV